MSTIPLPELDVTRPTPAPFPDSLSEFQRAASLQTAAAQQQAIMAQTQGQQQQNQMQALQLKDAQTIHDLAPQFVTKDDKGKPIGFDNEGFANAARGAGVNPALVNTMQNQYAEAVKNLAGATKAQVDAEKDKNNAAYEASESLRPVIKRVYGNQTPNAQGAPSAALAATTPQTPVPSTGGMPSFMLPNAQPQAVGDAKPGTPESLGQSEPSAAPSQSESAVRTPPAAEDMQAWHNTLMNLARLHVNVGSLNPNQIPTEHQLDSFQAGLGAHAQALSDAETAAKTAEAAGKGAQGQAEAVKADNIPIAELGVIYHPSTGTATSVTGGQVLSPAMIESKYITDEMSKGVSFAEAFRKFKTIVPAFTLNMNATGAGMIPGGTGGGGTSSGQSSIDQVPNPIKGTVQQILDYRAQMPPAGRNNPTNNAIRYWVNNIDPTHDDTYFPARNKMMTAMTSGPEAVQINAINAALGHVGVLNDAIDALHNSDGGVKSLRDIANKIGVQVGDTPVTTLNTIVHRVGPELTAAYVQGGGGEGERGTTAADFDPSLGNKQLKDNVAVTAQLLRSKIGSIENQYKNTMQRDDFQQRFITPEAQSTLNRLNPKGSAASGGGGGHIIQIGQDKYQYKGSGATDDLANYTKVTK